MTDEKINLEIAKLEYPETRNLKLWVEQNMVNYINDWHDIGPIIEREKIDLSHGKGGWSAYGYNQDGTLVREDADTPTRAAALCYLEMKGVE